MIVPDVDLLENLGIHCVGRNIICELSIVIFFVRII